MLSWKFCVIGTQNVVIPICFYLRSSMEEYNQLASTDNTTDEGLSEHRPRARPCTEGLWDDIKAKSEKINLNGKRNATGGSHCIRCCEIKVKSKEVLESEQGETGTKHNTKICNWSGCEQSFFTTRETVHKCIVYDKSFQALSRLKRHSVVYTVMKGLLSAVCVTKALKHQPS